MIQIYNPGNTDYEKNGDMTLFPTKAEVGAELNGAWKLEIVHPIDKQGRWKYLQEEAVIKIHSFNGEQLFKIRNKKKTQSGITAIAEPIFMDAMYDCFLTDVRPTAKNGQEALDIMTAPNSKYKGKSDIKTRTTAYYEYKNLIEAINGNDENSFIHRWGGEILFNNFEIIINEKVGGDYGVTLQYGKNIPENGISEEVDTLGVVTRIYPKSYNGHKISGDGYVDSPNINKYPTVKAATIKFDDIKMQEDVQESDEEKGIIICKTQQELDIALREKCNEQYEAGIDRPSVQIKADMVLLQNAKQYKDYKILETVSLGDVVHCKHSKLNIITDARVISLKYDAIYEKVTSVVLGDFTYNYFDSTSSTTDRVNQVIRPDGSIVADKIAGFIDAAYASLRAQYNVAKKQDVMAILFENMDPESPLYGAMALGTQGLMISKERTADGRDWKWTTAITANGAIADIIIAGVLSDKTGTNFWDLDTGEFALSSAGFTIDGITANEYFEAAKNMTMQLSNDMQVIGVDENGNYGTFPSGVNTTPVVMYGNQDITKESVFTIEKTNSITGTWNKDTATYTVTGLTEDSGWIDIKATYLKRLSVKKRFVVSKLYAGESGKDGTPGAPGKDGKTTYFHVKYSSVPKPTQSSQMTETPSKYIGTYADFIQEDSTDPTKYTWAQFAGDPGKDGIPGKNGEDGQTSYLHIAYANSADGKKDFSVTDATGRAYIGTYVDFTKTDSTDPTKYTWSLVKGENGRNVANVYLYQRAKAAPAKPTNALTYTFSTGEISGTINNGWSKTIPSGTNPLYAIAATASGLGATASIAAASWSAPVILAKDGTNGTDGVNGKDGLNVATVYLYQRKISAPAKPSAAITYTFSNGAVSGLTNGWSKTIPSGTAPLYVILATAASTAASDTIATSEWSTPTIMTENGTPGAPGRTYFLEPSTVVIKRGKDEAVYPNFVEFKAFYRDGDKATRTAYAGRFKIEKTTNGSTWTTIYTSSVNESSIKKSIADIANDIIMIRCTLYAAGGTSSALDTQSVAVVTDVDNLTHEEIFNLLTKDGKIKGIYKEGNQLYISFTYAKGGELSLGGANDGNGILKVYDALNNQHGIWDSRGIKLNGMINQDGKTYFYNFSVLGGIIKASDPRFYSQIYMGRNLNEEFYPVFEYGPGKNLHIGKRDSSGAYGLLDGIDIVAESIDIIGRGGTGSDTKISGGLSVSGSVSSSSVSSVSGKFTGAVEIYQLNTTGSKKRIVDTKDYAIRSLYCYEMPSPMFGDIGEGTIDASGACYIYLDDIFVETINTEMEYQVFLQKEGQGDLWVEAKAPDYFVVKGTPDLKFAWEIKAKQRDYEYERLEDTETTEHDVEIIDYEAQGAKLFEEYLLEKENVYEEIN